MKFTSSRLPAYSLLQDDYFRVGGRYCRISEVRHDPDNGATMIQAYHADEPDKRLLLTVESSTNFKIYNQK